jgi:hypothetical protein
MKHRAEARRRFWPAIAAAVLVATAGGGIAVLAGCSGHDAARPASSLSPSPGPGSTSAAARPTGPESWAWCSSDPFGTWNTSDGFDLYNNEWNSSGNPGPQHICGNSGRDWQVTSTQRTGNTAVLTYPSVQRNYPDRALSSFTSLTSSYTENMNAVAGTDAEAAYDIWINDLNKEVMFWVDNHGQTPAGSKVATVTLGGLTWNFFQTGGYYAFVLDHNAATVGSICSLASGIWCPAATCPPATSCGRSTSASKSAPRPAPRRPSP